MLQKKDFAYLVIAICVSAGVSYFISNRVFGSSERVTIVETVDPITSDFNLPDERFFNKEALNPTADITIGDEDGNVDPFNSGTPPTQQVTQ